MSKLPIKVEKNDFVIVQYENKNFLVEVKKYEDKKYHGVIRQEKLYGEDIIFFSGDISANLGKNPKQGKVFGVDTKYLRKTIDSTLGEISFFCSMKKENRKTFIKNIDKVAKIMRKFGLMSLAPFDIHVIREEKSKILGMYYTKKNKNEEEKIFDKILYNDTTGNSVVDTFCHELGHGIWNRLITKHSLKAKWIKLYTDHVKLSNFSEKDISKMRKLFLNRAVTVKEFKKLLKEEYEETHQSLFNEIIGTIDKTHKLSIQEIDALILAGDVDTLAEVWPDFKLILVNMKETNISEYAKKNVKEYFSECTRIYLTGGKLPKKARKLMDKTIQLSAHNN